LDMHTFLHSTARVCTPGWWECPPVLILADDREKFTL
jgi:hypothetical protein